MSEKDVIYSVLKTLNEAVRLMEKSKSAFKSKTIAKARLLVEEAIKKLEELL